MAKTDEAGNTILDGYINISNITCVSKARLGNLVSTLTPGELKQVDKSIAQSLDLIRHYAGIKSRLDDKLNYIEKLKAERNLAQDNLKCMLDLLDATDIENAKIKIERLKKDIDN